VNLLIAELINFNPSQHARLREHKDAIDAGLFVAAQKIAEHLQANSLRCFFTPNREINARTATGTTPDNRRRFELRKKSCSFFFGRVAMLNDPPRHGALTLGERLGMRFHLAICTMCPPFVRQVQLMRRALGRWKQYGDGEPPPS
jgi:hypothetical protein